MNQQLLQYACALRTHQLDDAAIEKKLLALGLTSAEAGRLIAQMDDMNWTAESSSEPTALGWLSILVAIGGTVASVYFLMGVFTIHLGVFFVIFVLPFVVLGFLAHVAFSKLLEAAGFRTSRVQPIPIPDEGPLQRQVSESRATTTPPSADA